MSTEDIARKLIQHCKDHTEIEGLDTLYSDDALSIEPMPMGDASPVSEGRDAIKAKHAWWDANTTVHAFEIEGPYINGNSFTLVFDVDVTQNASGERWRAKEVALYETDGEKIVRETFFMAPMT